MIKAGIDFQVLSLTTNTTIEYVAVKLCIANKSVYVVNLYIPPYRSKMLSMMIEFKKLIHAVGVLSTDDELIICGDFNINWHKLKQA